MSYKFGAALEFNWDRERQAVKVNLQALPSRNQQGRIFGARFGRASRFAVDKILAILLRADSPHITKNLCKVLLGLEATGKRDVQDSRIGSTQHRFSTLKPLAQNKLMRGLAR